MPPKKGTIAAGKQPEQRTQEAPSPPPTVLRHSNSDSMSQARPETPQLSDISDEEAFYDTEITSTTGPAGFIRPSKPLLAPITFPDLPAKAKDKNLDLILQMQKQMQEQQEKQQQQMLMQQERQERMQQQMQQNFLQVIERIAPSTQITPSNTHTYIHLKIQRLQENAKLMRSIYEKIKFANNRD